MIRLIQRRLIIPRGDTGTFTVPVFATNSIGDVAVFSIMDERTNSKVFEKVVQVSDTTMTIEFNHSDTVNLPVGKFVWDIKFYQNPQFVDGELVDGEEIDSYYAAFKLPVCEIRQTGDGMLMSNDAPTATLAPNEINYINASINEVNAAKQEVLASTETATASAIAAENSALSAATSVTEMSELVKTIPTKVSELENDSGYLTQHQDISGKANSSDLAIVATSGSYVDLSNKPFIPTAVSDLTDDSGHYIKPQTGIPASDLEETYLTSFTETDPTVPNWAKASQKPTYTAQEVGALPNNTYIPTKVSDLQNDSGYITGYTETDPTVPSWAKAQSKPVYTAAEVGAPTVQEMNTAIGTAIGAVNQFEVEIVESLPVTNIKEHTIYFVPKTGEINDVYDEYIRINNGWEMIGNTQINLSNYATKNEIPTAVSQLQNDSGYLTTHQDIQINGTSIVDNGVVNIPIASTSKPGVIQVATSNGFTMNGEYLRIAQASLNEIKQGVIQTKAMCPANNNAAAFFGLAKAAGDTTQAQSDNAVGTYTDDAKAAIKTMLGVNVNDVQVNGTSVVSNGVASIPVASSNALGVAKVNAALGISVSNAVGYENVLMINGASSATIKSGSGYYAPIVAQYQHEAAFYGLAKAAGDSTQSASSNAVGTYTAEAKAAIKTMLGVADPIDVQINGSSVVNNGVANIPFGNSSTYGVVRVLSGDHGLSTGSNGILAIQKAMTNEPKAGTNQFRPIVPYNQHEATFYGLAKAAGDSTQSASNNSVGAYTEGAKSAIYQMLNAPEIITGSTPEIAAKDGIHYICGEVSTLTITLPASGCFDVIFTSGTTPTVLTATGVTWPDWFDSTSLEANRTYEINIYNGKGVVTSWT